METYFPNTNSQTEAATMLFFRDRLPSSYPETPVLQGSMMMYQNPSSSSDILPIRAPDSSTSQQEILTNLGGPRVAEHELSAWKEGRNQILMANPLGGPSSVLQGSPSLQGQVLSLSLGTHLNSGMQMPSAEYHHQNPDFSSFLGPNPSGEGRGRNWSFQENENSGTKQSTYNEYVLSSVQESDIDAAKADSGPYGMSNISRVVTTSKYLKAAQQLLEEVVNVRKAIKEQNTKKHLVNRSKETDGESGNVNSDASAPNESATKLPGELSAAEKQDMQNKVTKLLTMLDEVDRRYKQYYHQMQIVVSSFDIAAGSGAAKPYTAVALQTISRHFRCLRDAINGQIRVARKSLGEEEGSANGNGVGISRLRYVDQQLRQQRALQQLGMMQQHTWRPQRGLPESSVSILRAWLFEHFLHPYPKDSDKIMLARQTGLTRSQVSNWFINARVRLWKPMVEEMYKEEAGEAEMDSNSSSETAVKSVKTRGKESEDGGEDLQQSATSERMFEPKSDHAPDVEMTVSDANPSFQNLLRAEIETAYGLGKRRAEEQRPYPDDCSIFPDYNRHTPATAYMSALEKFGGGNVSLTLGLQRGEGGSHPMSNETHHNFVTMRDNHVYNATDAPVGTEEADFDCMDSGDRQNQLLSPHLLHDFVA